MDDAFTYRNGGDQSLHAAKGAHPKKPGPIGLNCIGGVIEHLAGADGDRLLDGQLLPPSVGSRASGRRSTPTGAIRTAPAGCASRRPGRFEYRSVDTMVNPYLMASALLKAFDDGIGRKLDPGEPESRNIYQAMKDGKKVKKLPLSLGEALERARRRRGDQDGHARRDVPGLHALQGRRVGAVQCPRHRVGRGAVSGLPAVRQTRCRRELAPQLGSILIRVAGSGAGDLGRAKNDRNGRRLSCAELQA